MDAIPQPYLDGEARMWVEQASSFWRAGTSAPFAVTDAETGTVLGGVGFGWVGDEHVGEVGYWLRSAVRGRGLTGRAVVLVSRWSFEELGCERLQLRADSDNVASQRVAEKAGFTREGVLRSVHFNPRQERRVDFVMFSLLPSEID
jgi:RimJ/RimL family protein N-acetyltransferase